jgi:hypothetical protein
MPSDKKILPEVPKSDSSKQGKQDNPQLPKEIGGSKGPEPTRYGDWEHKGRCTDF